MEPQTSASRHLHINYIVLASVALTTSIIGGVVGAFANFYLNTYTGSNSQPVIIYQNGAGVGIGASPSNIQVTNQDIHILSGVVTDVNNNQVTVDIKVGDLVSYRTIIVDATTKIVKVTPPVKLSTTKPLAGQFTYTPVALANIINGDRLIVAATENIKTKKEFMASEIKIMPR